MHRLRNILLSLVLIGITYQLFGILAQALLPWLISGFLLFTIFGALSRRMWW